MVYSTVKPCFVKFLSCLRFKLGGLAKHLGECFVVASSRSYQALLDSHFVWNAEREGGT